MIEAKIAFHHMFLGFKSHQGTSFIPFTSFVSLLGISVGIMALIVVMSVMNGFERELQRQIVGAEQHIVLYRKEKGISSWQKIKSEIQKMASVEAVLPITYNEVLFIHKGRLQGGILEGILDPSLVDVLKNKTFLKEGAFLGEELAQKIGAKAGDIIQVLIPQSLGGASKIVKLRVLDIFKSGLYEYSSRYVYAPLSYTQKEFKWGNTVSAFKIKIKDPMAAQSMARKIRARFPFFIRTWMDMNRNIFTALKLEKIVMAIILGAIIVIAAFNVVSSLIMTVIEKTKEISILKALGMKKEKISRIFLWQGVWVGLLGTTVGVALAWGACQLLSRFRFISLSPDIYYLSYLPVEMRWLEIGVVCAGMVILSLLAAWLPARRAAQMVPLEGIRYE